MFLPPRSAGHHAAPLAAYLTSPTGSRRIAPLLTPDGRYLIVGGRLWRASNPALPADERRRLTHLLMTARREVGAAQRAGDAARLRAARAAVQEAKVALGERGPTWWTDGTPDHNRRLVKNSPYAAWYATRTTAESAGGP